MTFAENFGFSFVLVVSTLLVHFGTNFLDLQQIFHRFEVLQSSELGLFKCINSVEIASTFLLLTSLIFSRFSICLVLESSE